MMATKDGRGRQVRHYVTTEELDYLDELAAAWRAEHDQATKDYGIGPMHHDFARLAGALRRIREGLATRQAAR